MTTAATEAPVPPIPYVVASWLGYPIERIVEGLRRGSIAPPAGAPPGWMPPGIEAEAPAQDDSAAQSGDARDPTEAAAGDMATDGGVVAPEAPTDAQVPIAERAAWLGLVRAIDPAVDDATFDELWQSSGADDGARSSRVGTLLWRTVAGEVPSGDGLEALAAAIADRGTRGTLVALAEEGSTALAQRARGDRSVLNALADLDAFAFVGVEHGASPSFSRFDADTGDANASDAWIDDRAKHLAWREALNGHPEADDDLSAGWRFVDRAIGDAATLTLGDPERIAGEVVFARDDGDLVAGGAAVDRLHGGRGDDTLDGGAGDDLVEGAGGRDTLAGGSGNDSLDGGGGDDAIAGGLGDDRLAGGSGHDTYAFAAGDGNDVVVDSDGAGAIVVDGVVLTGRERGLGFETGTDEGGATTLVVRTPAAAGGTRGVIRVRDWSEGDLGIHLGAGSAPAPSTGTDDPCPSTCAHESLPVNKPLVTQSPEGPQIPMAGMPLREAGNESGMGLPLHIAHSPSAARPGEQETPGPRAVDARAWALALSAGPGSAFAGGIAAPPASDPAAVTAAEAAGAIAGLSGDNDGGDAAFETLRQTWWNARDLAAGIEPPDVLGRQRA